VDALQTCTGPTYLAVKPGYRAESDFTTRSLGMFVDGVTTRGAQGDGREGPMNEWVHDPSCLARKHRAVPRFSTRAIRAWVRPELSDRNVKRVHALAWL